MISRIDYKELSWVDVLNPSSEDIVRLTKEFGLNQLVAEELLKPSFRPRAESFGSHAHLILHLPIFEPERKGHRLRELDLVAGRNFLISVHYEPVEPLTELFNHLKLNIALRERVFEEDIHKILYYLWRRLYEYLFSELDHLQRKIDRIEDQIFAGKEKELIEDISLLRRDILDFHRAIRPHDTILEALRPLGREIFGESFSGYLDDLTARHRRIISLLENNKDALETLYDTNDSLLTHRSNEIMKTFTMLALLTFPLTLIATVFAIDATSRPIIGRPNDFWILLGILLGTVLAMLSFFRYRKWI